MLHIVSGARSRCSILIVSGARSSCFILSQNLGECAGYCLRS